MAKPFNTPAHPVKQPTGDASETDRDNNSLPLYKILDADCKASQIPRSLGADDVKRMYEGMILIRAFDERQTKLQRSGRIGFCLTAFGEEAVQVATTHALRDTDWVYPYYRQHGILLYRGVPLETMTNQLFGNAGDLAKGRQMPVHYTHKDTRYVSFSSVIGTHMAHAVGTAMASRYKKSAEITVTYIGDGGTSSNDFHSAMTLAGIYKPPLVIFIVNNHYAISQPVAKQCAAETLHSKGEGYGVPSIRVDGNDFLAVYQVSRDAYDRARAGEGPTLIELVTYRVGPHSSSDDPSRYRGNESDLWRNDALDPIARTRRFLTHAGLWNEAYEQSVWDQATSSINQAVTAAESSKHDPDWQSMFEDVYADMPPALTRQMTQLLAREEGIVRTDSGEFPL
ncbi:MAG: thiamine pyrophosphate-dependent dehydrogenase E1 component subunit alpha [Cyanobacteria bacterium P01_H01_bin.74]